MRVKLRVVEVQYVACQRHSRLGSYISTNMTVRNGLVRVRVRDGGMCSGCIAC